MAGMKTQLYTWGLGKSGQLGTGKNQTEHIPQLIKLPPHTGGKRGKECAVHQVSCGALYTAVVTEDGQVFVTGCGKYGRLGTAKEDDHLAFVPVSLPETVRLISCGVWHAAAVTNTNGLIIWGYHKACGTGETNQTSSSVTPPTLVISPEHHQLAGVSCGNNFTLAWTKEGRVLSWGANNNGSLGHGSTANVGSPQLIKAFEGEKIVAASAGFCHSAFVTAEGKVFICGKGGDGALGLGEKTLGDALSPQLVAFPDSVKIVSVSCSLGQHHAHTLALTGDGQVYAWGDGYKGKLGLGSQDSCFSPRLISPSNFNGERVSVVSAGGIHSTAATEDGSVFTWGCGSDGRCGHPEGQGHRYLFRSDVPKKVEAFNKSNYALVSCSYYHSAAIVIVG